MEPRRAGWTRQGHWRSRSRQRGQAEGLFLLLVWGIVLLFVVVYALALWLGKGLKGKLAGFAIATALLYPIWHPFLHATRENNRREAAVRTAATRCAEDLATLPAQIAVNSVFDETGGLGAEDVRHLLLSVQLKFVEVKLDAARRIMDPGRLYAWTPKGDVARMELANADSPACFHQDPEYVNSPFTRLPPGMCTKVTYVERPSAAIAISERRDSDLSHWEIRRLSDGAKLASVTDSRYPDASPYWDRRGNGIVCDGVRGYGVLMDRIRPANPTMEHSALSQSAR